MASISQQVKDLNNKFDSFIVLYNTEREADSQKLKDFKTYLEKDVSRALNSHKEIKYQLNENTRKIAELELSEAKCPIPQVVRDVRLLMQETEMSRAKYKYPEIKKGLNLLIIVSAIVAFVTFIGIFAALIVNWGKIF